MFDWKISLDTMLTIGSMLVFITLYIANMRATSKVFVVRLKQIDDTMQDFKTDIKALNKIMSEQAAQNARLDNMGQSLNGTGKRLDELTNRFNAWGDKRLTQSAA